MELFIFCIVYLAGLAIAILLQIRIIRHAVNAKEQLLHQRTQTQLLTLMAKKMGVTDSELFIALNDIV
ncbi:hypothetical protein [Deminuibacter soli]|uniref:Uncharacterized protein n=1 Tax=Deminuibacter soli TaxID=2291815 RepID=A0A3E1NGW4_9BACT|nr:hypothetical protein [Deminuibacter soli]RFM27132.1 hypothetical protein DXN05_16855 [Deminuibacter soli]